MLAIRLRRAGSKKRPYFRVVVMDSRAARDSSFLEVLGHYNPRSKPETLKIAHDRYGYWMQQGAQPSDTVRTLLDRHPNVPADEALVPAATAPAPAAAPAPESAEQGS